jgi:myo-inositol-hexaphosphate 3-phosphohydrolase
MDWVGDGNLSITSTGRNSYLNFSFNGEADLFEQLVQTGTLEITGNTSLIGYGDLSVKGGIKYPVDFVLTADGNLIVTGPAQVGTDYIVRFSLQGPNVFNFTLKEISLANFSLQGTKVVMG